jgi:signal transduction histidine kinase
MTVAALALVEIFILNPKSSWQALTGIRLEAVVLAMLGLAILTAPAIMAARALLMRQASPYTRRQVNLLLTGTGLALLPFTFLTALPRVFIGESWLPLEVTLPLLGAIPATYAYVIFRHRYLALDLFVARSVVLLLAVLLASTLFVTGYRLARVFPETASLAPVLGAMFLFIGFGFAGRASSRLQPAIEVLLYGPDRHYDETLSRLRDELLADPQDQTLHHVLLEKVPNTLDVRDAALLLADGTGMLVPVGSSHGTEPDGIRAEELGEVTHPVLHQAEPSAPVFGLAQWAKLAVVLRLRDKVLGALLLGEKAHGDYFDARDVAFVQRLAAWAGVAIENVQLFAAQQQTMAELLRVRIAERAQLASRLHDEPLQRAYSITGDLDQLALALSPDNPLAAELHKQRQEVRELTRELREISTGIRPPILNQGLLFALDDVIREFMERFQGIEVDRASPSQEPPPLSNEVLDAAYHIVKEALHNVGKHAQATQVNIRVECIAGSVRIIVSDNGLATIPDNLSLTELFKGQHQGIVGMHQWAMAAKGKLRIQPGLSQGTVVELTLPLNGSRGA